MMRKMMMTVFPTRGTAFPTSGTAFPTSGTPKHKTPPQAKINFIVSRPTKLIFTPET